MENHCNLNKSNSIFWAFEILYLQSISRHSLNVEETIHNYTAEISILSDYKFRISMKRGGIMTACSFYETDSAELTAMMMYISNFTGRTHCSTTKVTARDCADPPVSIATSHGTSAWTWWFVWCGVLFTCIGSCCALFQRSEIEWANDERFDDSILLLMGFLQGDTVCGGEKRDNSTQWT